jgi:toxin YoeB
VNTLLTPKALEHLAWWMTKDPRTGRKVLRLIEECARSPFEGTAKPEPLKGDLSGWWSRRITQEHRLIYKVDGSGDDQTLIIAACLGHYDD